MTRHLIIGVLLIVLSRTAGAEIVMSVDDEFHFVVSGTNDHVFGGIDLNSASGSLIPGPPGDAGPFEFFLANNPFQITYGQLGRDPVLVDGSIRLPSRWNPLGVPDVTYAYGAVGGRAVGPFDVFEQPPTVSEGLSLSFNDDYRFVIAAQNAFLVSLDLRSPGNSLVPGNTAGPFTSLLSNTDGDISLRSADGVTIDGELTLDAGWNRNLGIRDVEYQYRLTGANENSPYFRILESTYGPPVTRAFIDVSIGDEHQIVLSGDGQELRGIEFRSPSGSLLPPAGPGPFQSVLEGTNTRVAYAADGFVVLDGSLTLDTKYNIDVAGEDVTYSYEQVGFQGTRRSATLGVYPPNPVRSPLRLSVADNGQLVVSGIGQRVTSLDISSAAGSLEAGDAPEPFDLFATTSDERVALAMQPDEFLTITDPLVLPVAWDAMTADVGFQYTLADVDDVFGPIQLGARDYPQPVNVIADGRFAPGISFIGNGQIVTGVRIESASGSLIPRADSDAGPFDSISLNSTSEVAYHSENGVVLSGVVTIGTRWNPAGDTDLVLSFETPSGGAVLSEVSYFVSPLTPEPDGLTMCLPIFAAIVIYRNRCQQGRRTRT